MKRINNVRWDVWAFVGLMGIVAGLLAAESRPGEIKLLAQLIWGTDQEKPKASKCKEVDPKLLEKLKKLSRWKNYYEVDQEKFGVKALKSTITSMSHKCVLEVKHLGKEDFEIIVYGEGKQFMTVRKSLPKNYHLIIAGPGKENREDAWFIALSINER